MSNDESLTPAAHGSYRSGFAFGVLAFSEWVSLG